MSLKIEGKIVAILPIVKGTSKAGKEWQKMNFVVDTGAQYNPEVCFQIFGGDKSGEFLATNKVDDYITVYFNVSSREFNGKYYHNLDAWKWETLQNEAPGQPDPVNEEEDLPF
jgi:hypothetical protein